LDREGRLFYAQLAADDHWLWPVGYEDMGPWLPKIAVAAEDGRFWAHPGLDPLALARALAQNLWNWKIVSGASTVTVQTIRLLQPAPRTLGNKAKEFIQALKLERRLSKREILEMYLNLAPFGGNLKGVGAASWAYFRKRPADLSLAESAVLIAALRGPALYRPDWRPGRAKARRDLLLSRLAQKGAIAAAEAEAARREPLVAARHPAPQKAPRFAEWVLKSHPRPWVWGGPDYLGLATSMNLAYQERLEFRLTQALGPYPSRISGAGALLDNATGQILAYVGNARPNGPAGYVDLAQARRSPGSALKPFVYLEAMAQGLIVPATLLADTPLGLDSQAPRNFDRLYRGPVTAKMALANSLNAPAVRVGRWLGLEKVRLALEKAGFSFDPGRDYGDSIILGGGEVTLLELLRAYAILARGGESLELRVAFGSAGPAQKAPQPGREVFSPEAAWLVNEALTEPTRLPLSLAGDGWAFKSGTSHGYRDAWLAIYGPVRTAVFWLGDPKGAGSPDLSGLKALGPAAVLFFRDIGPGPAWPAAPGGLEKHEVCLLSGEPLGPFCPEGRSAYRLRAHAKTLPCRVHVRQNGRVVAAWPPELAGYMANLEFQGSPRPKVVSPFPGTVIRYPGPGAGVPLKSEATVGPVYWFVDGEFFQAVGPGRTPVLPLTPGPHRVSLVDDRDQTAYSDFTVVGGSLEPEIPVLRLKKSLGD
jgi:penicillin-binding protein 1C